MIGVQIALYPNRENLCAVQEISGIWPFDAGLSGLFGCAAYVKSIDQVV
jgi:hypothetical protein